MIIDFVCYFSSGQYFLLIIASVVLSRLSMLGFGILFFRFKLIVFVLIYFLLVFVVSFMGFLHLPCSYLCLFMNSR